MKVCLQFYGERKKHRDNLIEQGVAIAVYYRPDIDYHSNTFGITRLEWHLQDDRVRVDLNEYTYPGDSDYLLTMTMFSSKTEAAEHIEKEMCSLNHAYYKFKESIDMSQENTELLEQEKIRSAKSRAMLDRWKAKKSV
jgi:hypothetical protein